LHSLSKPELSSNGVTRRSARWRRRFIWLLVAAVPVTAIALVVVLVPERSSIPDTITTDEGPAQLADTHVYHLTRGDRAKIDVLLDRFIPAAVERRSAKTAWALAGPELHAYSSVAQWQEGKSPVPQYPARGTTFHYWTVVSVGKNDVLFNILLHPRAKLKWPSYELAGQVIRHGTGWRVNRLYTIATFSAPSAKTARVVGPNDFNAPASSPSPSTNKARLSHWYAIPLFVIFGGVVIFPLSLGAVALIRGRRFRRAAAGS
jgi:hypothetical protein